MIGHLFRATETARPATPAAIDPHDRAARYHRVSWRSYPRAADPIETQLLPYSANSDTSNISNRRADAKAKHRLFRLIERDASIITER